MADGLYYKFTDNFVVHFCNQPLDSEYKLFSYWAEQHPTTTSPANGSYVIIDLFGGVFRLPQDSSYLFNQATNETFNDTDKWVFDDCYDASSMFYECENLTTLNSSNWNTSNVKNMHAMFSTCPHLETLDVSHFNTNKVTDMVSMFSECGVTSLDLSSFNTSNIHSMEEMFMGCDNLTTLDLSSFDISKVTDFSRMFNGSSNLKTIFMPSFTMHSGITDINMFEHCENLEHIYVIKNTDWAIQCPIATDGTNMFRDCTKLPNWDGTFGKDHANNTSPIGYFDATDRTEGYKRIKVFMKA